MEKAIFITRADQIKYADDKYSRLYFGNEFCQRLIPSGQELREVLSFVRRRSLNFSLVTPYVTNSGMEKLNVLFGLLARERVECEVIVNDWGVSDLVSGKYRCFTPVLGRLLTKQKRGPGLKGLLERKTSTQLAQNPKDPGIRYIIFQKKLPLSLDPYYKGSNTSSVPIIHDFLIRRGMRRIELDNTAQGLFLELPKGRIAASLYLPYAYITTTFFCPTAGCSSRKKPFLKIKPCARECRRYIFKLRHKSLPGVIYLKGNTQFYKNTRIAQKDLGSLGIDRIVYQPQIPI